MEELNAICGGEDQEEEQTYDEPMQQVLFLSRYRLIQKMKKANVFFGVDTRPDQNENYQIILKTKPPTSVNFLKCEFEVYENLKSQPEFKFLREQKKIGFADVLNKDFVKWRRENFLVLSYRGLCLERYHSKMRLGRGFSVEELCWVAYKAIELLEFFHEAGYVHRDIHPGNFVLDGELVSDSSILTLIDFKDAYLYCKDGIHKPQADSYSRYGSLRSYCTGKYCRRRLSRKDDLEALGFMLVDLKRKKLPWFKKDYLELNPEQQMKLLDDTRILKPLKKLCNKVPRVFRKFIEYAQNLDFEKQPNYEYWKKQFQLEICAQMDLELKARSCASAHSN